MRRHLRGIMCILLANLRHLYQRRGLWLVYALLAFCIWINIIVWVGESAALNRRLLGLIVFAFLLGMVAAMIQIEVLTKPFAFCLPGHRQAVRSFIFAVGVVANLASDVVSQTRPGLLPMERVAVFCSAFFAACVFYCAGVWLTFRQRQPSILVCLLTFALIGGALLNLHLLLEQVVVLHPAPVIVAGLLCGLALWIYLSDGDLARRNYLRPWLGFGDVFDREKLRRFQQARGNDPWKRLKNHPRSWVVDFFIGQMNRQGPFSMARFLWGSLYTSFAIPISRSSTALILALFIAAFLGYTGPQMSVVLAFAPVILVQAYASRPALYSTMLTAGGRAERFASTLAVAVIAAGLLVLLTGIIAIMSIFLAAIMPDITFRGFTVAYRPVGLAVFYAPLVLLPLACTIQVVFYRRPLLLIIVLMTLIYLVMIVSITFGEWLAAIGNLGSAAAVAIVSWLILVLALRHVSLKRSLVK